MDQPVHLIPLVCVRCSTPAPAEPGETAWVCAQCSQGLQLDEASGLTPLEVYYAGNIAPQQRGKPYWVVEGQVQLRRQAYSGGRRESDEAEQFWSQPRRFFIPAFSCSLEELLKDATQRLQQPPALDKSPAAPFEAVTLAAQNIPAAAEFIVMAVEAARKDKLKKVDFSVQLSDPVLWILP